MTEREKEFRQAARQVILILDNFEADKDRVDKEVMDILKKNMDMSLKWTYNKNKSLSEQSGILSATYTLLNFLLRHYIFPKREGGNKLERDKLEKLKEMLDRSGDNKTNGIKFRGKKRIYEDLLNKENMNRYSEYYEYSDRDRLYKKIFKNTESEEDSDRYLLMLKRSKYKRMISENSDEQELSGESQGFEDKYGGIDKYHELLDRRKFYEDMIQMRKRYDGGESLDFMEWLREKYRVFYEKGK
ncbi:MAG: hypothetical protein IIT39_00310 [Clostridia bacterium]|nr:hypothetical protein [Clostridia bacterium]